MAKINRKLWPAYFKICPPTLNALASALRPALRDEAPITPLPPEAGDGAPRLPPNPIENFGYATGLWNFERNFTQKFRRGGGKRRQSFENPTRESGVSGSYRGLEAKPPAAEEYLQF